MDKVLLGVYGTLKQGHHNHDVFLSPRKPMMVGKYKIPYNLYSNGRYPMLVGNGSSEVLLEIYELPMELFQKIRDFETPFGYHVESVSLEGKEVLLFVYDKLEPPEEFKLVYTGDFQAQIDW